MDSQMHHDPLRGWPLEIETWPWEEQRCAAVVFLHYIKKIRKKKIIIICLGMLQKKGFPHSLIQSLNSLML